MHLSPRELDKLMLHQAGVLAQKRLARGLRLNYPEAVALIATQLLEFIRDGRSVAELMDLGRQLLGVADVMPGVADLVHEVQVEGHYHFVETNRALEFDREAAYGKRLDIPAGTAVRFEPGETKSVALVAIAGRRVIRGGNNFAREFETA